MFVKWKEWYSTQACHGWVFTHVCLWPKWTQQRRSLQMEPGALALLQSLVNILTAVCKLAETLLSLGWHRIPLYKRNHHSWKEGGSAEGWGTAEHGEPGGLGVRFSLCHSLCDCEQPLPSGPQFPCLFQEGDRHLELQPSRALAFCFQWLSPARRGRILRGNGLAPSFTGTVLSSEVLGAGQVTTLDSSSLWPFPRGEISPGSQPCVPDNGHRGSTQDPGSRHRLLHTLREPCSSPSHSTYLSL